MVQSAAVVQPAFGRQASFGRLGFPILGYICLPQVHLSSVGFTYLP